MGDSQALELKDLEGILSEQRATAIKLSYGLLNKITKGFSNEIGHGGFAFVYKGTLKNWVVAVKKISTPPEFSDVQFVDEIKCLRNLNHKNVVRFFGYCAETQEEVTLYQGKNVLASERHRLLCFEYVPNGNIRQYLQRDNPHGGDWPRRFQIIRGICHGLGYLHDNKINHLDLKPENVMLDAQMEPKITDFGLSRLLDQGKSTLVTKNIRGTLGYIAPEIIDEGEISFKADVYALGIIIVELLTGNRSTDLQKWEESLVGKDSPGMRECAEIARKCKQHDRHKRPTIGDVIRDLDELDSIIPGPSVNQERAQSRPTTSERTGVDFNMTMTPARSLAIAWVEDPQFWTWTSRSDSRYGECAELLRVSYLKVSMNIAPRRDQPAATIYTAHLVYKLAPSTSGLQNSLQKARTHRYNTYGEDSLVSLHPKASGAGSAQGVTYPITRNDGWLELKLAEFSNKEALTVELFHEDYKNEMRGLFIEGMGVRRQ